jgi:hypothetical protein
MEQSTLPYAIILYKKKVGSKGKDRLEVFCAPTSWLITEDLAYWPPYQTLEESECAAREGREPHHTWDRYIIQVIKYVGKLLVVNDFHSAESLLHNFQLSIITSVPYSICCGNSSLIFTLCTNIER